MNKQRRSILFDPLVNHSQEIYEGIIESEDYLREARPELFEPVEQAFREYYGLPEGEYIEMKDLFAFSQKTGLKCDGRPVPRTFFHNAPMK